MRRLVGLVSDSIKLYFESLFNSLKELQNWILLGIPHSILDMIKSNGFQIHNS